MTSYLSEDTDEEEEDPIKLFDHNAIYFGSQPKRSTREKESHWTFEAIGNYEFSQPNENFTFGRPDDDLVQTTQSGTTSECDISPLCVKLVDCRKFPWYYTKYTQQILHTLNLNEHSDSDHDIDEEGIVDDSDDCFIIDDLQDIITNTITNEQICKNTVKLTEPKPKLPKKIINKRLENMKRYKDDKEIQRALSLKNLVKVDLKRNRGLVGMKITQKIETDTTLDIKIDKNDVVEEEDAKQKCVMADEMYLRAADKALCHIGTQLIPITEEKESNSICQLNINNKEKDLVGKPTLVKSIFQNVPVQFDISKISEKLIDNLKTKKINNDKLSNAKLISKLSNQTLLNNPENTLKTVNLKESNIVNEKELSSKVTITEKLKKSSNTLTSHVKDVKKTNKYKNDQIKNSASHSSLIGLLISNKCKEDIKEIKCTKQRKYRDDTQNKATKLDKKPRKKIEKQKREPKSPILHCSTILKKPKQLQVPPKCNKTDTNSNIPKEPGKLNKIVDKLTHLNSCNLMQDTNRLKHVVPKIAPVTKPLIDVCTKQASQKESFMTQDKTVSQVRNIHAKSFNISEKLLKNCNDVSKADFKTNNFHNTQIMPSSQNKTLNEQNVLHEDQHKVNTHTINAASITNPTPKAPIINNKSTVPNSNVSTTAVITPASESNAVFSKQYGSFPTPHVPHFPIHNAVPRKMNSSNIPNNNTNVPVQNRYASAIILKSNNHTNFPFEKYYEQQPPVQTMAFQSPRTFLSYTQPRPKDPQQPYPIFYPSAPLDRHQSYFPSSANCVPNQFHPPQSHIGQQPSNPMQDFYRECWLPQNLAPPPPPPPPVPTFNIPPRNGHVVNQSKDCSNLNRTLTPVKLNPQSTFRQNSVNIQQSKNSSIIGINNDGLVKKINIVAMPVNNFNIKKGTVNVEQINTPQIKSPVEHSEVVATKTEMLKELDKLSFVDENIKELKKKYPATVINENKKENTLEVAIMSKKPGRFETLKLTMNQKDNPIAIKPALGYSPPILPIPTYQKVLECVNSNLQTQNEIPKLAVHPGDPRSNVRTECKPMRKRDFVKRKLNNACNNDEDNRKKKDDAKKISLEEYKKRTLKNYCKSEHYKRICKEKYNFNGKRPNIEFKHRQNVDYGTETDLGYDSDNTMVL